MGFFLRELRSSVVETAPSVQWEETNCLLCGSRFWSHLVEGADNAPGGSGLWFVVVQCQQCGLCFTNPRPTAPGISRFYPETYQPHRSPGQRKKARARLFSSQQRGLRWLRRANERKSLPWHGQGRLLDFGCGGGSYLERMHRQGWTVTGLDFSEPTVRRIRDELGLKAHVGTLPHPELEPAMFDVITMWHSLEHVHEPLRVLREARRLLVSGGKLLVAVPNIDSLPFRWFGGAWFGLDLPRHLTHFTPWTLTLMLQRAGFRPGHVRMLRHSEWLRSSARLACRNPRGPYWHRWLNARPASRVATWYSWLIRQADSMLVVAEC
jgi:2-polyprenyl-3-methyl-5-hydroxy-6-metoxy-1,4-benzoquinol methylase